MPEPRSYGPEITAFQISQPVGGDHALLLHHFKLEGGRDFEQHSINADWRQMPAESLAEILKGEAFDIIQTHTSVAGALGRVAARIGRSD